MFSNEMQMKCLQKAFLGYYHTLTPKLRQKRNVYREKR